MTNSVNANQSVGGDEPFSIQEDDEEISLLDLLQTIVDNLRLLVIGPLALGIVALGISFLIPPTYTAKTQFLPPQQQQSAAASMLASLGSLGGLAGAVGGIKNPADQYIGYLKSANLQDSIIDRFKLLERYNLKTKTDARLELKESIRISYGKEGLISIEADASDPQFAADLANAHVEELGTLLGKLATTEAQQRRLFFEKQLMLAKNKLIQSEIILKATGVSGGVLKSNPAFAIAGVAGLQAAITAQEVKLGNMRGYLAETAPDFKQAISELVNLKAQLAKQEIDVPSSVSKAQKESDYISKYRDFKYHETLFELFSKQLELAKVDEAREGALIQVLDIAQAPERKTKPNKSIIVITVVFVSELAFLLFVFTMQALANASKNVDSTNKIVKLKNSLRRYWPRT